MKKVFLTTLLAVSITSPIFSYNALASAELSAGSIIGSSVVILSGVSLVVDSLAHSFAMNDTPTLNVEKLERTAQNTVKVEAALPNKDIPSVKFEVSSLVAEQAKLKEGATINVTKTAGGYLLNSNNKVIAIAPENNNMFKHEMVS